MDPATVQASDFTVNGIPANTVCLRQRQYHAHLPLQHLAGDTQGPQTMHIPAGAFIRDSDNMPNFEFNCSFCYAITPLMVTTTVPPVGGTFTPPAPGDYNYDVNFNQAVDPASVTTADLTLTGNAGGSVTAVQLINGNMTARFTLHFNFGGSVTASIGAGTITANRCNPDAAFTGNYTVEGCPPQNHYDIAQIGGSIVPGTTDTGNHGDDDNDHGPTAILLLAVRPDLQQHQVSSNGNAQFTTTDAAFTNVCPAVDHSRLHYLAVLG